MDKQHCGRQSIRFAQHPVILAESSVAGKKEAEGPLCAYYDHTEQDTTFQESSWEKSERKMQEIALNIAISKAGIRHEDLNLVFAGDLLNQCISSSHALRNAEIPYLGLYGACSTMAEGLILAGMSINGGFSSLSAVISSSHFASAERQYRFPLGYGGQRTPTAQWTVTGCGCALVGLGDQGLFLNAATIGTVIDYGIKDANNMGAAMAPAAFDTIRRHFDDLKLMPEDYDLIVTGDLGQVGKEILLDLFQREHIGIGGVYQDCGTMVFDMNKQDVHSGGSGCGCGSIVLCGYILRQMRKHKLKHVLFCGTGALLSPLSVQQGESIPSVCHAVSIGTERR